MYISKFKYILNNQGVLGLFRIIMMRLSRLSDYKNLKENDYALDFIFEGNIKIKLPKVFIREFFPGRQAMIRMKNNSDYTTRPTAEALFRKSIFEIYQSGYICSDSSIIDIGSWIGDNSLVWSKYLSKNGKVLAIDPSYRNISYGKLIAEVNKIDNIRWIEAVCAERSAIKLDFNGSIDHASFKKTTSDNYVLSTTIDDIVKSEDVVIGFLHVDVEGFELSVLRGSEEVILKDRPVIAFEQHISKENFNEISEFLKSFKYKIFMVNEVLPDCALDCRNFLAFPAEKGIPELSEFDQSDERDIHIHPATLGSAIIEV